MSEIVRFDCSAQIATVELGRLALAARVVGPRAPAPDADVLFCFAGGGFAKEYFDMAGAFSFADALAQQGFVCVLIDHAGVGGSAKPDDGYLLHPEHVARADMMAVQQLIARLRGGTLELPAMPQLRAIGIGHSMGGMLTGVMQGQYKPFSAVAILGAGPYGLYDLLPPPLRALANDPARAKREIQATLRDANIPAYVEPGPIDGSMLFSDVPAEGVAAMLPTRSRLIATCGFFSMIPQSWADDAARIETPVLLAYGDHDLRADLSSVEDYFPRSRAVKKLIFADTSHMHFAFPSRFDLFDAVAAWAREITD